MILTALTGTGAGVVLLRITTPVTVPLGYANIMNAFKDFSAG